MHCGAEVTESSTNKQHHLSAGILKDALCAADVSFLQSDLEGQGLVAEVVQVISFVSVRTIKGRSSSAVCWLFL